MCSKVFDKSGKHSQSELLAKELRERGFDVVKSEFHRYDTPTGKLIRSFLHGEYASNQLAIECLMAADKYAQLDWFNKLAKEIDVLILDRYVLSQIVYGVANGTDVDFILGLLKQLPEPCFHFYLDVTPEESMKRKGKHGDNDKYEGDFKLLTKVRGHYLSLMEMEQEDDRALILDGTRGMKDLHIEILDKTLSLLEKKEEDAG